MKSFQNIRWFISSKMPTKRKLLSSKKNAQTIVWTFEPGWRSYPPSRWHIQKAKVTNDHKMKNWKRSWPFLVELHIKLSLMRMWLWLLLLWHCEREKPPDSLHENQKMRQRQECSEAKVWPCEKINTLFFLNTFYLKSKRFDSSTWSWYLMGSRKRSFFIYRNGQKNEKKTTA